MDVQIMHRGLIPMILKRGPIASIDLDPHIIRDLLSRGVDVRKMDGSVLRLIDLVSDTPILEPKIDTTPVEISPVKEPDSIPEKEPEPVKEPDPEPEKVVEEPAEEVTLTETPAETEEPNETEPEAPKGNAQIPMVGPDGQPLSRNQRKKLQRAAAEAAAKAGAQPTHAPETDKK